MHISPSTDISKSFSSDDLSFEFIPKVEAELEIDIPQAEWYRVKHGRRSVQIIGAPFEAAQRTLQLKCPTVIFNTNE